MNNDNRTKGEHNADKHMYTQWMPAKTHPECQLRVEENYCHENAVKFNMNNLLEEITLWVHFAF